MSNFRFVLYAGVLTINVGAMLIHYNVELAFQRIFSFEGQYIRICRSYQVNIYI